MIPNSLPEAIKLLRSDLVWSKEFDAVRKPLADVLEVVSKLPPKQLEKFDESLKELVYALWVC